MYKVMRRFFQASFASLMELSNKNYITNASALAYTTILSIVPLLSVFIYTASFSYYFYTFNQLAKNYVTQNLLPSTSSKLIEFFDSISHQASQLPTVSFIFLLVTAILLIMSIDKTMNFVWRTYALKRKLIHFVVYITCLFIIPFIIAMASILGAFMTDFINLIPILNIFVILSPLVINSLMLFIFYYVTARRNIKWHSILCGSITATILLELLKTGFKIYISHFSNYQNIYGALSIIPVFLIWIFIFWTTIIYGALIAKNMSQDD